MSKLDFDVMPKLGFGMMRLPLNDDGIIDLPQVCDMVDAYIESGLNYFDTAYPYHKGESEKVVKKALVERYPRDSFILADKMPGWELHEVEDVQRIFNQQLERTGAGYFDMYLLHAVDGDNVSDYEKYGCWSFVQEMKAKGLIKHVGFSFHDTPEVLERILKAHPEAEFVQLQINYLDWENEFVRSREIYHVACKYDKPIVVMEPIKGGTLANIPPKAAEMLKTVNPSASQASFALRFCASLKGVITVLSGMSNAEQMADNLVTLSDFHPITEEEKTGLNKAVEIMLSASNIGCTGCRYCTEGCPMGINIPDTIWAYNHTLTYGDIGSSREYYKNKTKNGHFANTCIKCGQCEGACPQHLPIIEVLEKASEKLDKK